MRLGDETRDTPFDGHFAELMSALPPKANIGTQSCRAFGLIARLSQTAPKTRSSRSAASLRLRRANAPTAGCLQNRTLLARPSPCHSGYARANRWSSWADI